MSHYGNVGINVFEEPRHNDEEVRVDVLSEKQQYKKGDWFDHKISVETDQIKTEV